jgi:chromate transporter
LKSVFWLGLTAFGGPQMHLPYFKKSLIDKHKFLTQEELLEINAFCSALPGPSTTQTLTTIGLKLGGTLFAIKTLMLWCLPGAVLMTILALSPWLPSQNLVFMAPLVLAFLSYGTHTMYQWFDKSPMNGIIFWASGILGFLISSPWMYPITMLVVSIIAAKFGHAPTQAAPLQLKHIRWRNLTLFIGVFIVIGALGIVLSKNKHNSWSKPVVLFENTYRMSALSLGGGHILAAMTLEQYVHHTQRMSMNELHTGIAIIQASPGPNFNLATYTNAVALKNEGYTPKGQLLGALIGLVAVFLPGTLFVFFAYPIWEKIKFVGFIQRSVPALFTLSVGFILSATLKVGQDGIQQWLHMPYQDQYLQIGILSFSLLALASNKIPTPLIVVIAVIVSWIFG